jgi:hypothetical protein
MLKNYMPQRVASCVAAAAKTSFPRATFNPDIVACIKDRGREDALGPSRSASAGETRASLKYRALIF